MSSVDEWLQQVRQRELDQFPVGTEVVVTLDGECRPYVLHGDRERGARGIVIGTDATHRGDDHPIWVLFRQPLSAHTRSSCYAPGELKVFDWLTDLDWTDEERTALQAAKTRVAASE